MNKRHILRNSLFIAFLYFLPSLIYGETLVSGGITSNTVWTLAASPYHVTGDILVTVGNTLTIEPGVTIKFDDGKKLTLRGSLDAQGTSGNHIIFTSNHPDTATKGSWVGIRVETYANANLTLKFGELYFAETAIWRQTDATQHMNVYDTIFSSNSVGLGGSFAVTFSLIERCTFRNNTTGVNAYDWDIYNSLFENNTTGLESTYSAVHFSTFTGNVTALNGIDGLCEFNYIANNTVGVRADIYLTTVGSDITNNGTGVVIVSYDNTNFHGTLNKCNIYNNTSYDLRHLGYRDFRAPNVYWGTADTSSIDTKIYDFSDDVSIGIVTYQPILTSPYNYVPNPAPISNLSTSAGATLQGVNLTWAAPGDNNGVVYREPGYPQAGQGGAGPVIYRPYYSGRYRIKYSDDPNTNWTSSDYSAEVVKSITPGQTESYSFENLIGATTYYFRVWTADGDLNWSPLSNGATHYVKRIKEINDLTATTGTQFQEILLNWTTPTDQTGQSWSYSSSKYRIAYNTDSNNVFDVNDYEIEIDTNTTSGNNQGRVVTGLSSGTTYYFRIWMRDAVSTWAPLSNGATAWAQADLSPPTSIGTPQDAGAYSSTTTLTWTWSAATDSESGINGYYISIGTTAGGTEVLEDFSVGNVLTFTKTGLTHSLTYYAKIKARNGQGLFSGYSSNSNGIKIDTTTPSAPTFIYDGDGADVDRTFSTTQLLANWDSASDSESGIAGYWYAIGTSPSGTDVRNWTSAGNVLSATATGLTLNVGSTYYVSVRSENNVGLLSEIVGTDGINARASVLDHYEVVVAASVSAGAIFSVTINAKNVTDDTLTDVSGNVTLQAVLASNTALAGTGDVSVKTASLTNGTISFSNQTYIKAEAIKIKVTDGNSVTGLSGTVTVAAGSAVSIQAQANPGSVISGQSSEITVDLTDVYSNPAPSQVVQLSVSKGHGQISVSSDVTNTAGRVTTTFTTSGLQPEANTIHITAGNLSTDVTVHVAVLIIPASGGVIVASEDPNTKVDMPANAVTELIRILIKLTGELASPSQDKVNSANGKNLGQIVSAIVREFNALKQDGSAYGEFGELATIQMPYTDNDNDGIEDTTGINVNELKILRLNETKEEWETVQDGSENIVDKENKVVKAEVKHFSIYSLGRLASSDLDSVVVYPNPVKFSSAARNALKFDNLAVNSEVNIYDLKGHLVRKLSPGTSENDGTSGRCEWLGKNESGDPVAAGLYYFFIKDDTGHIKKGRFAVIK